MYTLGDVVFGGVFTNAFLCMEGETREFRFVFLEILELEDPLFSSTRQTFVTEVDK